MKVIILICLQIHTQKKPIDAEQIIKRNLMIVNTEYIINTYNIHLKCSY